MLTTGLVLDAFCFCFYCSPLVVTLRAFVNATFVDSSKNVVYNNLSYLPSIFLAIKKAEDAVDARTTHVCNWILYKMESSF